MKRVATVLAIIWASYALGWYGHWAAESAGLPDPSPLVHYRKARTWVEANLLPTPTPSLGSLSMWSTTGSLLVDPDPSYTVLEISTNDGTLKFFSSTGLVATIDSNGSVTIPANVTLDSAGKGFWRAVEQLAPRCP